jgi:predicted DNA-binding transcriptional regulator AlpA
MHATASPVQSASPAVQSQQVHEILTVAEVAQLLRCKESSIYNLTRRRGQVRYDNPIPVLRLPCGLRFKRSSVLAWLDSQESTQTGGVQ